MDKSKTVEPHPVGWMGFLGIGKTGGTMDNQDEIKRLHQAVEINHINFLKFRGQWEETREALEKYQNGAFDVLTRLGLAKEFYWKEIFWRHDGDGITRAKTVIEFMAEALLTSRKKVKELERQLRLYRAETPEDRRKEVDAAIKEIRRYDWHAPPDPDVIGAMSKRIKELQAQLRRMQEGSERRNKQLEALHVVWCDGGCSGGCRSTVTEDLVVEAELNVKRLRTWWENRKFKGR